MELKKAAVVQWLTITAIAIAEFLIIYRGDLPPGTGYSALPIRYLISSNNSIFVDGAIENNFILIISPLLHFGQAAYNSAFVSITFITAFLSVAYAVKYFSNKYFQVESTRTEILLIQVSTAIPYTMSYYFSGGQFFGYGFFIALMPVAMTVFDRVFTAKLYSGMRRVWLNGLAVGITASLLVVDTRTLLYTILVILAFSIYALFLDHSKENFKTIPLVLVTSLLFYILINIRFFISIFILKNEGLQAIGDIVPVQLFIVYMKYNFYYAITASANWFGVYNAGYVGFGLIATVVSLVSLMRRKIAPIVIFFFLALLLLVLYVTTLSQMLNYALGQTHYYPYLVYTYPIYVFNILYDPFYYLLFGLGLFTLLFSTKRVRKFGKILGIILVASILLTQVAYLEPEAAAIHSSSKTVPLPSDIDLAAKYLYAQNLSGNVMVLANFSLSTNQYLSFPNAITQNTGWNGWLMSFPDYLISNNYSHFAKAMTYLGVQYILYNSLNYSDYSHYLAHQSGLREVFENGSVSIYRDTYFEPTVRYNSGIYVAYNMPQAIQYLSDMNVSLPLVPFYDLQNFSSMEKYISGVVLPEGMDPVMAQLLANQSDSYMLDPGAMNINQAPFGWQVAPIIFLGDQINAIFESDPYSPVPLELNSGVPIGNYYVFVQGGVATTSQFGSSSAGFNISSGNSSVTAMYNQTAFAPMTSESFAGLLNISNSALKISPINENGTYEPFLSRITLIPESSMALLGSESLHFLQKIHVIHFPDNLTSKSSYFNPTFRDNLSNIKSNFTVVVDYSHENMGLWTYVQPAKVEGEFYHASYDYGLYNIYLSNFSNPEISYLNSNGAGLIYLNLAVDGAVATLSFVLFYNERKRRSG